MPRSPLAPTILALLTLSASPSHAATLEEAIAAAAERSPVLKLAHEQTVQAEAIRTQAWALISPKVNLQGTYTINEYEIVLDFSESIPEDFASLFEMEPITIQQKTALGANGSVIQPLFDARSLPLLRSAARNLDAARADERRASASLRAGVARVYYGVAVAREAVAVTEGAVRSATSHLELAQKQVTAGLAPPRAALAAELAVAQAQRDLANAREGLVTAEEALVALTGLPRDTPVSLPEGRMAVPDSLDAAVVRAQSNRPELAAADARARAARLQSTAQKLSWLPTVDGRFTYVYDENIAFSDDPTMWMVVFTGSWLLWDGGARVGAQQQAASNARMAQLLVDQAQLDLEQEVRVSWEKLQRAESNLSGIDHEVALAQENLRLADTAWQSGGATWLEAEDARLGLVAAQLTALQARANRDLAAVDLLVAIGEF